MMSHQWFQDESQFIPAYRAHCQDKGRAPDLNFRIDNRSVRLFRLWQVVCEVGGGEEVSKALLWHGLAEELLGSSENNSVNAKSLREIYYSRLLRFELELKQEKEEAAKQARVPCFVPQPRHGTIMMKQESMELPLEPKPKKSRKDKRKLKKKPHSSRMALIPTATIVHANIKRQASSGDTPEPEPAMFRPKSFSPQPDSGPEKSGPVTKPPPTQYFEPPTEAKKPSRPPQPAYTGTTVPNGSRVQAKEPRAPPIPRPLNPSQATNAMLASGFQPLMVSHEHMKGQPSVSTGPQIRPMMDPFSSYNTSRSFRAKMNAIANGKRDAPLRQPSPLGPGGLPKEILISKSGFMPLSNPSADPQTEKVGKATSKSSRHVNRHTVLTANCNTRAHIPMLEVLADLAEAETAGSPSKKQKSSKSKQSQPHKGEGASKKRKASSDAEEGLEEELPESRQTSPFSLECHEQGNDETSEDLPPARMKRRGRPPRDNRIQPEGPQQVKVKKTVNTKRVGGKPPVTTIKVKAHTTPTDPSLPKKSHKKGAAALYAFHQELAKTDTVPELVSEIRRAARSFTFPVSSPDKPAQKRSAQTLANEPLHPAVQHLKTSLNPLLGSASPAISRESSPALHAAAPSQDLSKTGRVELNNTQTKFLAHVRGQCWVEEPQASILPKDPTPAAAPAIPPGPPGVGRRSTRQRTAPVTFSPNFGGSYDRKPQTEKPYTPEMHVGPDFQTTLPACLPKPKPSSPMTARESAWLQNLVNRPGDFGDAQRPAPVVMIPPEAPNAPVRYACGNGAEALLTAAKILDMGLTEMGTLSRYGWSAEDVALFEKGLNENRRDFAEIAKTFLPHKGCLRVCSFYYNLWKSRAIPEARRWYAQRDEAKRRAAEEKLIVEEKKVVEVKRSGPTEEKRVVEEKRLVEDSAPSQPQLLGEVKAEVKLKPHADRLRSVAEEEKAAGERMLFAALKEPLLYIKTAAQQPHARDWAGYSRLDFIQKARQRLITANINQLMAKDKAEKLGVPVHTIQPQKNAFVQLPRGIVKVDSVPCQMASKADTQPNSVMPPRGPSPPVVLAPLPKVVLRNSPSLVPARH